MTIFIRGNCPFGANFIRGSVYSGQLFIRGKSHPRQISVEAAIIRGNFIRGRPHSRQISFEAVPFEENPIGGEPIRGKSNSRHCTFDAPPPPPNPHPFEATSHAMHSPFVVPPTLCRVPSTNPGRDVLRHFCQRISRSMSSTLANLNLESTISNETTLQGF